jgi:6-methylsalicylate decarboxylase
MSANRVDTHFHIVPERFTHAIAAAGGGPSGWHVPAWSPESAISAMTIVQQNPKRFGWFASLPGWTDVQGTLDEIEWVFEVAKADGVVVLSSYDDM